MPYRGHLGASPDPLGWVTPETGKRRLRDTTVPEQPQRRKEEEVGRLRAMGAADWVSHLTPHYVVRSLGACLGHALHLAREEHTVVRGTESSKSSVWLMGPGRLQQTMP